LQTLGKTDFLSTDNHRQVLLACKSKPHYCLQDSMAVLLMFSKHRNKKTTLAGGFDVTRPERLIDVFQNDIYRLPQC